MTGLSGLRANLVEMHTYLSDVAEGRLPMNRKIIANMQEIVNLLPNFNIEVLIKAFLVKSNDMSLVIYVASLIRTIIALHSLLTNKLEMKNLSETSDAEKPTGSEKKAPTNAAKTSA